jgi:DNA-binding FadR family transcriptional regulator
LMVELTGNQTLVLMVAILEGISRAAALKYSTNTEDADRLSRRALVTREKLIELIQAGDADAAEELYRKHLSEAGEVLAAGSAETVVDLFG